MNHPENSSDLDFSQAEFTAIISDLHLCEEEKVNPLHPLWKKYKTREFFYDDVFKDFLVHLEEKAHNSSIELILNGDIFDFDSVMVMPENPPYRISWLEKKRGLFPREERSVFKIEKILIDHQVWTKSLSDFIKRGHRVVFIIGNHDLELHFPKVQAKIIEVLALNEVELKRVRFNEWFYISNQDTLVEHGNQYDPYCLCQDPLHPYVEVSNSIEVRLPFGNLACRYMINGMGFFNPHVDSNYIMSIVEYVKFFLRYMLRAQPLLMWTWFWGAFAVLVQSILNRLRPAVFNPLTTEDKVENVAKKANATPRMVREMAELFVAPAESNPYLIARELWLDRAFLVLLGLYLAFAFFTFVQVFFEVSIFWMFVPILILIPFFFFYSKSFTSNVHSFKEPREKILAMTGLITKVSRVIYGHTHIVRHESIGPIEHLNSGSWSPAFLDVECTKPIDQKTFIWLEPTQGSEKRKASLFTFERSTSHLTLFSNRKKRAHA
jgi:UDP-2,3-diacylglucosamine pyrophosphatase LpxH